MTRMHDLKASLEALATFPDWLRRTFHSFPSGYVGWKPPVWDGIPSERLTAIEQVCHVRDIEIEGYRVRFHRTRTELAPVLPDLPGESMALERNYAGTDPVAVLRNFAAARMNTVETIRGVSPGELSREA